jgi:thiol-disulfide isomerase/thioredoxin
VEKDVVTRPGAARWAAASLMIAMTIGCGRSGNAPPASVDTAALQARLEALRGRPTLLVFWATWCKPCVAEIPELVALHREAPAGLRVVAVSLDHFLSGDNAATVVADFLRATPLPYEQMVYFGSQDALLIPFDLSGSIPYAILYDAAGTAVHRFEGLTDAAQIRAALATAPAHGS